MKKTLRLLESYKSSNEYKLVSSKVSELSKKKRDMSDNMPTLKYPSDEEMRKSLDVSPEEWQYYSKSEKTTMYDMFRDDKDDYDKWWNEYNKVSNELSEYLEKLKDLKNKEYENQYKDKDVSLGVPTNKTEFEGFKVDTGEYRQDYLLNPEYAKQKGYNEVYIAEMTPDEYMHACAKYIFQSPIEDAYAGIENPENTHKYAKMMKDGTKFNMPYIDIKNMAQEGRHRALAAKELGINKIPVLILK